MFRKILLIAGMFMAIIVVATTFSKDLTLFTSAGKWINPKLYEQPFKTLQHI